MRARPTYSNSIVYLHRQTDRQEFRFVPTPEVVNLIEYLLGALTVFYNMRVFAFCMLSNHYHGLFDDPDGNYPAFLRDFHARLALGIKDIEAKEQGRQRALLGRVFDGQQPNRIYIHDQPTLLQKTDYIMNQPVAAGATRKGNAWKGVRFAFGMTPPEEEGWVDGRKLVRRPEGRVPASAKYPPTVMLEPAQPPGFDSAKDAATQIRDVVLAGEKRARTERSEAGLRFSTWSQCVRLPRTTTPANRHRVGTFTPRHSSVFKDAKRAQLEAEEIWLQAYAAAWQKRHDPNTVFPRGTYYQRVYELRHVDDMPPRL